METMTAGACDSWVPLCARFPDDPTPQQQILIDAAIEAATEMLWVRTRQQFGTCTRTFRPCRAECLTQGWGFWAARGWNDSSSWSWPFPALIGGNWYNLGCGSCSSGNCSCTRLEEFNLPAPLHEILEIRIDGEVLAEDAYTVWNNRTVIRMDGGEWPRCNDLSLPDTEPGTWSATAIYGNPVPKSGQMALGELATQLFWGCPGSGGSGNCIFQAGVVKQIQRQGVTKVFITSESFSRARIGLPLSDLFISTFNPSGTGPASIFDIDGPRRQSQTFPPGS